MRSEIAVYVPAADHPAVAGIARGSAIVGRLDPGGREARICFEGAVYGQVGMKTLADRAVYAVGRLQQEYPTTAARTVPRDSVIAVGIFEPSTSEIVLTGEHSAAIVAEWLNAPRLDPAELRLSSHPAVGKGGAR